MTRETHHAPNPASSFHRSPARQSIVTTATVGCWLASAAVAAAQSSPAPPTPAAGAQRPDVTQTTFFARNWTRVETWRFFEPRPGGGDPDYAFIANRLLVGVRHVRPRWELNGAAQYVQFGGLPDDAIGPGALGTGALYFDASQDTSSSHLYLKALNVRFEAAEGLTATAGRMPYTSGAESPSGVPAIEMLKRQRLDARLVGEFEWSIHQRAFDGVRVDVDRPAWRITGSVLMPTQGGFEESANVTMTDVKLFVGNVGIRPQVLGGRIDLQLFGSYYDDRREVRGRPDNTGLATARADVGVTTLGAALASVYPTRTGELDAFLWFAAQAGDWYEQDHQAYAVAAEAGHRWPAARWSPWLRGGVNYSSGDDAPFDDLHGTFFQMLPTARKYAFSATYTQMNLRDVFGQVIVRPRARLTARLDVHRLDLAQAADRWYAGSGATEARGTFFGYAGRVSGGASSLGTVVESAADLSLHAHWSVNGYIGRLLGGDVVRNLFVDDRMTFFYLESVIAF